MDGEEPSSSGIQPDIADAVASLRNRFPEEFERFNDDIHAHFAANKQDDETYQCKMALIDAFRSILRKDFPERELYPVGSTLNGLGARECDLDLCFLPDMPTTVPTGDEEEEPVRRMDVGEARRTMDKFMRVLDRRCSPEMYSDVQRASCGGEPILKFTSEWDGRVFDVDLSVLSDVAVHKTRLLRHYARIDDRFPTLCLVIKEWARVNGIRDAKHQSFQSYAIVLLVVHFLQCAVEPPVLPNLQALYADFFGYQRRLSDVRLDESDQLPSPLPESPKNEMDVGELLIRFIDYYATFDFKEWAVSMPTASVVPRSDLPRGTDRYPIYLLDFYEPANMARSVSHNQYPWILDVFRRTRSALIGKPHNAPVLNELLTYRRD